MNLNLASGTFGSYKAPFSWNNIPQFVVLTGVNGSGKSQLLQMIRIAVVNRGAASLPYDIQIDGIELQSDDIVYMTTDWPIGSSPSIDISSTSTLARNHTQGAVGETMPIDTLQPHSAQPGSIPSQIAYHFMNYYVKRLQVLDKYPGIDEKGLREKLPIPPWELVNSVLKQYGAKYAINRPTDLLLQYTIMMEDHSRDAEVLLQELSGGEKAIITLALQCYAKQNYGALPKLLLLDEPDAHLHPGIIKDFLSTLKSVFIDEFKCRIVMSTHRPETVLFAPKESLFEVNRDGDRIVPIKSRSNAIRRLSSNLISMLPSARVVFVEDKDDEEFYNTILDALIENDDIDASLIPVFKSVAVGDRVKKITGGKYNVKGWSKKLQESGLEGLIFGIIDKDDGNVAGDGVFVIQRRCIENYIFDPIVAYASMIDCECAEINECQIKISAGAECNLKTMSQEKLQEIANFVIGRIQIDSEKLDQTQKEIEFVRPSIRLKYPTWIIEEKKETIKKVFFKSFGEAGTMKAMLKAFKRVRMVPIDLKHLLLMIINDDCVGDDTLHAIETLRDV